MSNRDNNPPVDKFSDYPVEVALFERHGDNGTWYNAQVSKTYKEGDEYKRTNNFNRNDLLKLNALVPQALSRMQELAQDQNQANGRDEPDLKQRAENRRDRQQAQSQNQDQGISH